MTSVVRPSYVAAMESTTLRRLSHDTAEVLAQVAAGTTVEITKNGKPVARIIPIVADPIAALVARRVITMPSQTASWPPAVARVRLASGATGTLLDDVRTERR